MSVAVYRSCNHSLELSTAADLSVLHDAMLFKALWDCHMKS